MKIPLHNLLPDGSQTSSAPRRRTPPREERPFTVPIERHPPGPLFRMPSLQLRVRGLFAATVLSLLSLLTTAKAEILFSDDFSRPDGPIVELPGTPWRTLLGTPAQIRTVGGSLRLQEGEPETVEAPLAGQPITNRPVYAGFTATVSALPSGDSFQHFAAFSIVNGPRLLSRVVITTQSAAPGKFRIGVTHGFTGTGGLPAPTGIIPVDLSLNTPFRLVLRQGLPSPLSTVWVNPTTEEGGADNSDEGTFLPASIVGFMFRQRLLDGQGMGTVTVDDLVVATTFDEVKSAPVTPPPTEPRMLGRWPALPRTSPKQFTAHEGYLYVPSLSALRVFDIRDPANRQQVMVPEAPQITGGPLVVAGNRAYSAGYGLRVLDVSTPANPRMLGFLPETEVTGIDVAVADQHVFILDYGYSYPSGSTDPNPAGLYIVDASDPAQPRKVSFLNTTASYTGLMVSDGYVYTRLADEPGSAIFDVRDPMKPAFVRNFPGKILAVSGQRAYVVPVAGRLQVLDISNPANPVVLGTETKPTGTGLYDALRLEGDLAYVVGGASLFLYDVSNPAAPRRLSELKRDTGYSSDFAVWNKRAFFAVSNVHVVDATDPARPRPEIIDPNDSAARVRNPFEDHFGSASDVAVDGRYAYVADYFSGMHIIDISDSAQPRRVASVGTQAASVAVAKGYAYVRKGIPWERTPQSLEIYDVVEPKAPRQVATVPLSSPFNVSEAQGVYVFGSNCFVATTAGLVVFDVSNPTQPRRVATVSSSAFQTALRMVASGNHLYVTTKGGGLRTLDISNPSSPREVGRRELNVDARDVALSGDQVFWSGPQGVHVENVSNPSRPVQVGTIFKFMPALATSRGHLFVSDYYTTGLKVYALNPSGLPTEMGSTSKRNSDISRLLWANGKLFAIANSMDGGLLIFSDPFAPAPPNLSDIRRDAAGAVRLTLKGAAGSPFTVERSPDLLRWETWSEGTLQETDAAGRELIDDTASTTPYSFYRIRKP